MTERRTLPINCPRCGVGVTAEVHQSDVRVRAVDVTTPYGAGYRDMMRGLEAEVTLLAEHVCAGLPTALEGQW